MRLFAAYFGFVGACLRVCVCVSVRGEEVEGRRGQIVVGKLFFVMATIFVAGYSMNIPSSTK